MGTFSVMVNVGNPSGGGQVEIEALVDTGASDSISPRLCWNTCIWRPARRLTTRLRMEPK